MEIVFFVHAKFLDSQSMPRFAKMLAEGMTERGHTVTTWSPKSKFIRFAFHNKIKKWLGYLDQYILFPQEVKNRLKHCSKNTVFVFTDHALGPWVPLVAHLPHVIHCHDFLAQRSGLGEIIENITGWTGRLYQSFIRKGYSKGKNFISVSKKTREDLHRFLSFIPACSEMVYNGLSPSFQPGNPQHARNLLGKKFDIDLSAGFILHVGGNQWYKNRLGVLQIYNAWRSVSDRKLPLVLIGAQPGENLVEAWSQSSFKSDIHFLSGVEDEYVRYAYAGGSVFLFPSLAEGFGWPIAEAMASGCPVITTNEAPMTEVAGKDGFLIDRKPFDMQEAKTWAIDSAKVLNNVLWLSAEERKTVVEAGIQNAARFNTENALNRIESVYTAILQSYQDK